MLSIAREETLLIVNGLANKTARWAVIFHVGSEAALQTIIELLSDDL